MFGRQLGDNLADRPQMRGEDGGGVRIVRIERRHQGGVLLQARPIRLRGASFARDARSPREGVPEAVFEPSATRRATIPRICARMLT